MKACRRQRQEKNAPIGRGQTPLALQEQSLNIPSSRISSHVISCLHASSLIFSPLMVSYLFSLVSSDHLSFFFSSPLISALLSSALLRSKTCSKNRISAPKPNKLRFWSFGFRTNTKSAKNEEKLIATTNTHVARTFPSRPPSKTET